MTPDLDKMADEWFRTWDRLDPATWRAFARAVAEKVCDELLAKQFQATTDPLDQQLLVWVVYAREIHDLKRALAHRQEADA